MAPERSSASGQRRWQRCATVDHSDIRGSSANARHHGRDPSGAALRLGARVGPGGCRIELREGSPLPRATTAAVCLRFAPYRSRNSLGESGGLARPNTQLPLHVYADGPDKAEQFAPDGRNSLLLAFTAPDEARVTLMQAVLRLPGHGGHRRAATALPDRESLADGGWMSIGPGRLHHNPAQVRITGLANGPATHALPARVLARDGAGVGHQLARVFEARELTHLGHDRNGTDLCDPTQALQGIDHRAHLRRQSLDRCVDRALQARNALGRMLDLVQVVAEGDLLCGVLEVHRALDPMQVLLGPRARAFGGMPPVAQQELAQSVTGAQLITLSGQARAHQVTQRLVRRIGHPHRGQIPRAPAAQHRADRSSHDPRLSPARASGQPPRISRPARSVASTTHTRWDRPRSTRAAVRAYPAYGSVGRSTRCGSGCS